MQPLKKELCLNKKYSLKFPDLDQEKTDQIKKQAQESDQAFDANFQYFQYNF